VIVEILNEDGTMARRPDLEAFATEHGLKIGTIADLIHYRVANEKAVMREHRCELPTEFGTFEVTAYRDTIDKRRALGPGDGRDQRRYADLGACASAKYAV
jgi:3,4-dihydroxy 2-butanone 4-phosphate synthase/GTP cyclohydrolase II